MEPVRIVVANEPRAYREVLAAAVQELRPQLEVLAVEPAELDGAVARLAPRLVVCSQLSEVVETRAPAWVVLYPEGEGRAVIGVGGRRTALNGGSIDFARVLMLIDKAAHALLIA
jgi:hypothetical protein